MPGTKRERKRLLGSEVRINLFRCDQPLGKVVVPEGLMEFVGRVLGDDPDYRALARELDQRFFDGRLRGYTVWRSKLHKDAFGYTDFRQRKIFLQECLFSSGLSRTVLVRVLLHEMCHAYVDVQGGCRKDNSCRGADWRREVRRVNAILGCDLEDEADVDWVELRKAGLDKLYTCGRCGKKVIRMIRKPPDARFFSWVPRHTKECGGEFELSPYESWSDAE